MSWLVWIVFMKASGFTLSVDFEGIEAFLGSRHTLINNNLLDK